MPVKCSGLNCPFKSPRNEIARHEDKCENITQTCIKCKDDVPRSKQQEHDCVRSMVQRYKEKARELGELTQQVEAITLDISKQQVILDKLN